jgi:hypothetical protein
MTDDSTPTPEATTPEGAPTDPERALRVEGLTQALIFALLTANEQPYPIAAPAARRIAELLDDCGARMTDEKAAEIELPNWVTERVREQATPLPVEPDHHGMQDSDRVMVAPTPPKRIAKKYMGVVEDTSL